jgi:hypothetical protein
VTSTPGQTPDDPPLLSFSTLSGRGKWPAESCEEKLWQNLFSVILNEVKDLEVIEKTRFFAALRMTRLLN